MNRSMRHTVRRLQQMLEDSDGKEIDLSVHMKAVMAHQSSFLTIKM